MSTRIVIVGGVAGGMSAAARARRMNEEASIVVLEKGHYVSFANCGLPYYIAGRIQSEDKLLITTPQRVRERFNIDARVLHEVTRIDPQAKCVEGIDHGTGQAFSLGYDKLIIATGANPIIPPIENIRAANVFLMRSMEDTQAVQRWLKERSPKSVAIVGAGFIGLEMAEAMVDRGLKVTVIEKAPHPLPMLDAEMARPIAAELAKRQVNLIAGCGLKSLRAKDGLVNAVEVEDGRVVDAEVVLLSIGVRPNVGLAQQAGVRIGASGAIAVDEFQRTSNPDIYAVGDASEVIHGVTGAVTRIPLAGPANRQGRLAGEHAAVGSAASAGKVLGTAIVKIFDLSVGMTGLSEEGARKAGIDADVAYVLPADHATYYPGAQAMRLKVVYEKATGRLLGAQGVGGNGVDKRIDVIATAIHFGGSIDDLTRLDLAYAPQFGSAKDPIHMAGFVAQNQRSGLTPAMVRGDLKDELLLDVRTPTEFAGGSLPGALNIPVDELRGRLGELERGRPIAVMCQVGLRGHVATRILRQHGFAARNLKGGYAMAK